VLDNAAQYEAVLLLAVDQRDHVFGGQRLEIQPIGCVIVGADGLRVAVDHDGLEPGFLQGISRVDATIVEFDALPDAIWAATQNDYLLPVGWVGLTYRGAVTTFESRIHIRC